MPVLAGRLVCYPAKAENSLKMVYVLLIGGTEILQKKISYSRSLAALLPHLKKAHSYFKMFVEVLLIQTRSSLLFFKNIQDEYFLNASEF